MTATLTPSGSHITSQVVRHGGGNTSLNRRGDMVAQLTKQSLGSAGVALCNEALQASIARYGWGRFALSLKYGSATLTLKESPLFCEVIRCGQGFAFLEMLDAMQVQLTRSECCNVAIKREGNGSATAMRHGGGSFKMSLVCGANIGGSALITSDDYYLIVTGDKVLCVRN